MSDTERRKKRGPRITVRKGKMPGRIIHARAGRFDKVEIIGHALKQMRIRNIPESIVLRGLKRPTRCGLPTSDGRKRIRKIRGSASAVDIVYEELEDRLWVIIAIHIDRGKKRKR